MSSDVESDERRRPRSAGAGLSPEGPPAGEARAAVVEFAREKPTAGSTQETGFAALAALLLEHADASAVLAAMSALESENPSPVTLSLLALSVGNESSAYSKAAPRLKVRA